MRMKSLALLTGLASATISAATLADTPRYDFADVLYQSINDPSSSGLSSDHAYVVDGSYGFTTNLIGAASYGHETADLTVLGIKGTASGNSYEAGLGYRFALTESLDLVPNLSYDHSSATSSAAGSSVSNSDSGYDAGLLLRAMLTSQFELDANVDHTTPGSSANTVGIAALYNFTPSFAVGVGYATQSSNGQNTNGFTVALRYYFK